MAMSDGTMRTRMEMKRSKGKPQQRMASGVGISAERQIVFLFEVARHLSNMAGMRKGQNKPTRNPRQSGKEAPKKQRRQRSPSDAGSNGAATNAMAHAAKRCTEPEEVDNDPQSSEIEEVEPDVDITLNVCARFVWLEIQLTLTIG
jgi:hypothetical protein